MEGKRFGIGLAAGILLGLAIIGASGTLQFSSGGLGALSNDIHAAATTTTTASQTSTSMPLYVAGGGNPPVAQTNKTFETTTTTSTSQNLPSNQGASTAAFVPAYSSRVSSIASQPLLSSAVVLVPVLLAFLLGAVLYRVSNRGKEPPNEGSS